MSRRKAAPAKAGKATAKPEQPNLGKLTASIVEPEGIDRWTQHYAGSLTPQRVSQVIAAADMGRPRALVDLVHAIRRKDGTIHAGLQVREMGVKSLTIDCVEPELSSARKRKRSRRAADELKAALSAADNTAELLAHLTGDGCLFGRAWAETIWSVTEANRMWFERFELINSRRFVFRQADAKLLFDVTGLENETLAVDLVETHGPGKYIEYYPRIVGDDLVREGLKELVAWIGLFRNFGFKDLLQTAESQWKPRRVGTYKKVASPEDIEGLKDVLARLATGRAGLLSEHCKIDELWNGSSAAKQQQGALLDLLAREFLKAALGSSDVVEPANNGSRSATETRDVLRQEIREAEAIAISKVLTKQLSEPFTQLNYGPSVAPPVILLLTEDVVDIDKFSQSIERFRNAGLPIPQSYVYDRAGIPEPKKGEAVLGKNPDDADPERDAGDTEESE